MCSSSCFLFLPIIKDWSCDKYSYNLFTLIDSTERHSINFLNLSTQAKTGGVIHLHRYNSQGLLLVIIIDKLVSVTEKNHSQIDSRHGGEIQGKGKVNLAFTRIHCSSPSRSSSCLLPKFYGSDRVKHHWIKFQPPDKQGNRIVWHGCSLKRGTTFAPHRSTANLYWIGPHALVWELQKRRLCDYPFTSFEKLAPQIISLLTLRQSQSYG